MNLDIEKILRKYKNKNKAKILKSFFKTGPGEYGEGDIFLGIAVPQIRSIAKECQNLEHRCVVELLHSSIHEERLLALLIFVLQYQSGDNKMKLKTYKAYLANTKYINNWDLVDLSAANIVGDFLMHKNKFVLYLLANSNMLWEKRISIVATFYFIRKNKFNTTLKIVKILLKDKHDLIHKACGWMLREVGKRDELIEKRFLNKFYKIMPRTMLRYAIEKFPQKTRRAYLKGKI